MNFHNEVQKNKNTYYKALADSWVEQRAWGFTYPLQALANSTLAGMIQTEFDAMTPSVPDLTGFQRVNASQEVTLGGWARVAFSTAGALVSFTDTRSGQSYADASHVLGLLQYQVRVL